MLVGTICDGLQSYSGTVLTVLVIWRYALASMSHQSLPIFMTVVDASFVAQMDFTIHTVVGWAPKVSTAWSRAGGESVVEDDF